MTSCSRASAGQGVGSGRAAAAMRRTACRESGRPGLGGGGGGAQREYGVAVGAGGAGEHHLAVLLDDALGQR